MGASVTLVTPALTVRPGQEATGEVRIRNTGSVVDESSLDDLVVEPGMAVRQYPGLPGQAVLAGQLKMLLIRGQD